MVKNDLLSFGNSSSVECSSHSVHAAKASLININDINNNSQIPTLPADWFEAPYGPISGGTTIVLAPKGGSYLGTSSSVSLGGVYPCNIKKRWILLYLSIIVNDCQVNVMPKLYAISSSDSLQIKLFSLISLMI